MRELVTVPVPVPEERSLEYPGSSLEHVKCGKIAGCLTVRRYSTARSGLKKAARMARSISARAKPMLSMLAMAASRSPPIVRAEGSLKRSDCCAGAGEGVAGTFCVEDAEGAEGAAGAAGVWAGAAGFAGVEGAALLAEAAGALGCSGCQYHIYASRLWRADLGDHAHNEALLLDAV